MDKEKDKEMEREKDEDKEKKEEKEEGGGEELACKQIILILQKVIDIVECYWSSVSSFWCQSKLQLISRRS
jgi:hypothetical protein